MKNRGLFLNMARGCFLFRFFVACLVCGGWLCGVFFTFEVLMVLCLWGLVKMTIC